MKLLLALAVARVISLSPSVTEIVAGVGAFDQLVAISKFCQYPEAVEDLPRVGGWTDTNLEQVVALAPDLVILTDAQAPLVESKIGALGISTLVVGSQSLEDIFSAIDAIGDALGHQQQARALARDMRAELSELEVRVRGRPRPKVLTVVDRLPGTLRGVYIATEGSFLTDLVRIAGGEPITPKAAHNYTQISAEAIVSFDPDVVLDLVQALATPTVLGTTELAEDPLEVWQSVSIRAVRAERVYHITDKRLVHPSHYAARTAREIARRLHPGAFSEDEP